MEVHGRWKRFLVNSSGFVGRKGDKKNEESSHLDFPSDSLMAKDNDTCFCSINLFQP